MPAPHMPRRQPEQTQGHSVVEKKRFWQVRVIRLRARVGFWHIDSGTVRLWEVGVAIKASTVICRRECSSDSESNPSSNPELRSSSNPNAQP